MIADYYTCGKNTYVSFVRRTPRVRATRKQGKRALPHRGIKNALPRPDVKTAAKDAFILLYRQCSFCKGKHERSHQELQQLMFSAPMLKQKLGGGF